MTAQRDGAVVDVGGARAQTLLALLALRVGSPVSPESLVDELWAGEPPDAAPTTLRSYVSRLRTALGGDVSIERATAGYVLSIAPDAIDAVRFERAVREADALVERGRHRRAADVLRGALTLWRGDAFAGLADDGTLRTEAARLEELRMHAVEARIAADLGAGRDAELVDELEQLVANHPFRERLWHHLMLALYRGGRQADALAAYHRAREALDAELGIEPSEALQELERAILRQDVPGPGHAAAGARELPVALTRFIGRERELDAIHGLLRRARLVTLVGVGGVGKTRLAIEAARAALNDLVDRVTVVDLAALSDPALLEDHVRSALGADETQATSPMAAIREAIGTDEVLLVLDNCEHLRDATATLAQALLTGSPELRILATSRITLDVAGEATFPVPPLALAPTVNGGGAPASSEAVALLLDRATLTRHDLVVDDAAIETAARICRDLDGLPLAIELAAARTKALSLDEIATRIRDRFEFLVSWRRLSSARHQTLREAMDWSYELLDSDEQQLLARLSVFPAGATSRSIALVCLDGDVDEAERVLERLVDASLVVPSDTDRGTRYRLLETVRQYGAERLGSGDAEALRRRHAEHMRDVATSTGLSLETSGVGATAALMSFELAREELPSMRAAISWATSAEPSLGVEIAAGLERFWVSSHAAEGAAVFTALLLADLPDALRARALRCRGGCRYSSGEYATGIEDYEAALAIHERANERAHVAHLLMRLAFEAERLGDRDGTKELLERAARTGGDERFPTDAYAGASIASKLAFEDGDDDAGFAMLRAAADRTAAVGDSWWRADIESRIAERALDLGRLDVAGDAAREALRMAVAFDGRDAIAWALAMLALEAAARGLERRAGLIWGGLDAEVERRSSWDAEGRAIYDRLTAATGAVFTASVEEGRSLAFDAVIELALTASQDGGEDVVVGVSSGR